MGAEAGRVGKDCRTEWKAGPRKVRSEIDAGALVPEFKKPELDALGQQVRNAEEEATGEVRASYRFLSIYDSRAENKLKTIGLEAGYATGSESLTGRVISSLKQNPLLNDSAGPGYGV